MSQGTPQIWADARFHLGAAFRDVHGQPLPGIIEPTD